MDLLNDFKTKNFPEQMNMLAQIRQESGTKYIADLFTMYHDGTGDKTADAMVEHTLREVLQSNEPETVEKITSGNPKEKKLCLEVAGNKKYMSAVPAIVELVKTETDSAVLTTAFIAMSELKAPQFLEIFREHIHHADEIIAAISIEMLGSYHDVTAIKDLEEIILQAESDQHYEYCTIGTADAIESMAALANDDAIRFLVSKIHHRNPTARRMVQEELIRMGSKILPLLETIFHGQNPNQKIMAAGIIGRLGAKEGGRILVSALDRKLVENANVRASIYEALGYVHGIKGLICLMDGLVETDLQVLMTVITSLDHQVNATIVEKIKEIIASDDLQGQRLVQAIVHARATQIFEQLFSTTEIKDNMISTILSSNDQEVLNLFAQKLESIEGPEAKTLYAKIIAKKTKKSHHKILTVDDSKPIRLFYRSIITRMNIANVDAENGADALEIIKTTDKIDLIITDLNMPVMDGLEFTVKLREIPKFTKIPIIMCTTESDLSQVSLAEKKGVNDFLVKPINEEILKAKINTFLN